MTPLRIRLFGTLELTRDGRPLPGFPSRRSRSLFAYLVVHRKRPHPRDVLAGTFWAESPGTVARKRLRTDLWRIRSVLDGEGEGKGKEYLSTEEDGVAFDRRAEYWLDVEAFEELLSPLDGAAVGSLGKAEIRKLEEAAALYRGDLLEGNYDDWCLYERERLRLRLTECLHRLIRHYIRVGRHHPALVHAHALLARDPLLEHVHRDVMRCHALLGDRPSAIRQYRTCVRVLREELDIAPMPETTLLLDEIRSGRPVSLPPAPGRSREESPGEEASSSSSSSGDAVGRARRHLDAAYRRLAAARRTFAEALGELPPTSGRTEPPTST